MSQVRQSFLLKLPLFYSCALTQVIVLIDKDTEMRERVCATPLLKGTVIARLCGIFLKRIHRVELYGDSELFRDSWGERGWGEEGEDMFRPKEVTMREGGRRNRDGGATDSGTYAIFQTLSRFTFLWPQETLGLSEF